MTKACALLAGGLAAALLGGCGGGPQPADWQLNSSQSMAAYQRLYLLGDARAEAEYAIARRQLASTGREDLVARAELARCATRAAALEFDDCPGYLALQAGARPEEAGYAEYLAGRASRPAGKDAGEDPLSRLVSFGVRLRNGSIAPAEIGQAVDIASAQGWRRPLLAWLGVQEKRAKDAGDPDAAARIRRRIDLVGGGASS
jgi:hypothetical protein